ncbi:MAG: MFS transporter [Gammaproteobacteria bacterium]|nr:MFS transporter [Gammaproteobacteria bacterium]
MHVYARLSGFYFFYYATVGAFMPYWSPYLEARGFSAAQMGVAYALMGLTRSVMPIAWGWWADVGGRRMALIRVAVAMSLALFLCIPFASSHVAIAGLMLAYSLFWHALLPQFEVVALQHLTQGGGDYSRVRLWGSVGFVAAVLGLGPILDWAGILPLPWLVGVFFAAMAVSSWMVPDLGPRPAPHGTGASLFVVLRRPEVLALLAACLLSQLSFAPYYNFFTLFLERHHHTRGTAGLLWALAVIAEILLFLVMGRLIRRVGARRLLVAVLAATALRWLLTPLVVDSLRVLVLLQLSHALTFGAYHSVAMYYVQRYFPDSMQGRGQAIYNALAYGVGGSIGSLGAGYIWEAVSPEAVFYAAAAAAALGWWIAWRRLPPETRGSGAAALAAQADLR